MISEALKGYNLQQAKMANLQASFGESPISRRSIPFMEQDPERRIVSMCVFNEKVYVATQKGVYIIKEDKLHRLEFVEEKE